MVEIFVFGGTIIARDPKRRVTKEETVAFEGNHIVDGEVFMEKWVVKAIDETEVLEMAQKEARAAISRSRIRELLEYSDRY